MANPTVINLFGFSAGVLSGAEILFPQGLVVPSFFVIVIGAFIGFKPLTIPLVGQIVTSLTIIASSLCGRSMMKVGAVGFPFADAGLRIVFDFFRAFITYFFPIVVGNALTHRTLPAVFRLRLIMLFHTDVYIENAKTIPARQATAWQKGLRNKAKKGARKGPSFVTIYKAIPFRSPRNS